MTLLRIKLLPVLSTLLLAACGPRTSEPAVEAAVAPEPTAVPEQDADSGSVTPAEPDSAHLETLARDVQTLLSRVGTARTDSRAAPGSIYTLADDIPFIGDSEIELETFGLCSLKGIALEGGRYEAVDDGTLVVFGVLRVTVHLGDEEVMTVHMDVSDEPAVLARAHTPVAEAQVGGEAFEMTAHDGTWVRH